VIVWWPDAMPKSNRIVGTHIQYAALPYRRRGLYRTEVLLVTSRNTGRWIIPKGWPIRNAAPYTTAKCEAREEAGVVGTIGKRSIGSYTYKKQLKRGTTVVCEVYVFAMNVIKQEERWPEKGQRKRKWLSRSKAAKTVGDPALGRIIRTLRKR
jgi:8-oxo-dGTP pyrophosphatase MutT (NUDIX family)